MDGRQLGVKVKGWQVAYLALFYKRAKKWQLTFLMFLSVPYVWQAGHFGYP
jgi:hypothetical protein